MPRLVSFRLALVCALALLFVVPAAVATGKGPAVKLRVVGAAGKVLAQRTVFTGAVSLKTSSKATCLGAGTGGSGDMVKVKGNTALGVLAKASKSVQALRPLQTTDHFRAEFGLGLCGIGRSRSSETRSWYLKVNHKDPQVGGEQATVKAGDEVLWALAPFPYPEELVLNAPRKVKAGRAFEVKVFAYDDSGKRKPAAGVTVKGASGPTGSDGIATVTLSRPERLQAKDGKDIPSGYVAVCVLSGGAPRCP